MSSLTVVVEPDISVISVSDIDETVFIDVNIDSDVSDDGSLEIVEISLDKSVGSLVICAVAPLFSVYSSVENEEIDGDISDVSVTSVEDSPVLVCSPDVVLSLVDEVSSDRVIVVSDVEDSSFINEDASVEDNVEVVSSLEIDDEIVSV